MKSLLRILIVDDEKIFHTTLKNLFDWEEHGFLLVGFASDGQEALNIMENVIPDIVITDILMPVVNGITLTKQLKSSYPDVSILVISSFDDFNYVKEAMRYGASDYILKTDISPDTIITSIKTIASNRNSLINTKDQFHKNDFLCNLINNYYKNLDFISESLERFNLTLDLSSPFFIVKGVWKNDIEPQHLSYKKLIKSLGKLYPQFNWFYDNNGIYILCNTLYQQEVLKVLQGFPEQHQSMVFTVSDTLHHIEDFTHALVQLEEAKLPYFYNSNQHIFLYNATIVFKTAKPISHVNLDKYITSLDFSSLKELLIDSLDASKLSKDINPIYLKKNIEHIIYHIISFLENLQYDVTVLEIKKLTYFKGIANTPTIDLLKEEVTSILQEIQDNVVSSSSSFTNQMIIDKIEHYIAHHYDEKIFLSDVADYVHLNYHYLSKVFNSIYGEGFNDYLNTYRINKAKGLLLSTDLPILEIAINVGFMDQSYFSKIFKKNAGMSPRKFRSSKIA